MLPLTSAPRAIDQAGQNPNPVLDQLAEDLDQLLKNERSPKNEPPLPRRASSPVPDGHRRWSMLMRDWGPDGNLAWMLETIRLSRKPGV